jgi:hypothetical protein
MLASSYGVSRNMYDDGDELPDEEMRWFWGQAFDL